MLGPLFRLRLYGFCCPCLESEDDYASRAGAISLQTVPVKWWRKVKASSDSGEGVGGNAAILDGISPGLSKSLSTDFALTPTTYVGLVSTLDIIDTNAGPAIRITPRCSSDKLYEFVDDDDSNFMERRRPATKTIPLKDVGRVCAGDGLVDTIGQVGGDVKCDVKVYGKSVQHNLLVGPARPLIRLDIFESVVHGVSKEEVVQHLNTLLQWNQTRLSKNKGDGDAAADDGHFVLIDQDGGKKPTSSHVV